ncbi:MAG: VOC family protein [Pseudomonadota bacterium]
MITALDHAVLICPDLATGIADYIAIFGRGPDWVSRDESGGSAAAQFRTENCAIELMAPAGSGPVGERLHQLLTDGGPRLTSLAFATGNISDAHHTLTRRGLSPSDVAIGGSHNAETGESRNWKRIRLEDRACGGIKTFILECETAPTVPSVPQGAVARLDHLVINTPNPDRAAAFYGARLGLRLALDRTAEQWNTRFLFFRVGGLTLEVIHRLDQNHDTCGDDSLWGITWAVDDLEATHARLTSAGVTASEIRTGRKPGSRVFTAKSHTLGVPTLFIAHEPR